MTAAVARTRRSGRRSARPPIVFDLEIGHVPPHLPLVNGALARLRLDDRVHQISQRFC